MIGELGIKPTPGVSSPPAPGLLRVFYNLKNKSLLKANFQRDVGHGLLFFLLIGYQESGQELICKIDTVVTTVGH